MKERTLTLDTAIEIVRATEMANKQLSKLVTTLPLHVSAINKPTYYYRGPQICKLCGDKHERGADRCPAYGKKCTFCGKLNHAAKVCFKKNQQKQKLFGVKGYKNCTHDYGSPQSPKEIGHVTYEYPPPPANHYVDDTRPVHHGQDTLRAETHNVRYDRARHASQELSRNFPSKELGQLDIGLLAVNYDNNVSIGEVVKDWYETIYVRGRLQRTSGKWGGGGWFRNFGHSWTGGGGMVCESSDVRKFLKKSKFQNFSELFKV